MRVGVGETEIRVDFGSPGLICGTIFKINISRPFYADARPWVELDFGREIYVAAIETSGDVSTNCYTKAYSLQTSADGVVYEDHKDHGASSEPCGRVKVYQANTDPRTVVRTFIQPRVSSRYLRVVPVGWFGRPTMTIGVLGCESALIAASHPGNVLGVFNEGSNLDFTAAQHHCSKYHSRMASPSELSVAFEAGITGDPGLSWLTDQTGRYVLERLATHSDYKSPGILNWGVQSPSDRLREWDAPHPSPPGSSVPGMESRVANASCTAAAGILILGIRPASGKQVFPGNTDRNTPVTNLLDDPVDARYVRFLPQSWYGWMSMRVEILGCNTICLDPLGMESGAIPDDRITASSYWGPDHEPFLGRLNEVIGVGAWVAMVNVIGQWLQVDFGEVKRVRGTMIQGRHGGQWVKSYKLQYSVDGVSWTTYAGSDGSDKIFPGNTHAHIPVTNLLDDSIDARYVRFLPQSWYFHMSMRAEILGCNITKKYFTVRAQSFGFDDPGSGTYIASNGQKSDQGGRGHHVFILDERTGEVVDMAAFDTLSPSGGGGGAAAAGQMTAFLEGVAEGRIIAIVVRDSGDTPVNLTAYGSTLTHPGYRESYAMITQKGATPSWFVERKSARGAGPTIVDAFITTGENHWWYVDLDRQWAIDRVAVVKPVWVDLTTFFIHVGDNVNVSANRQCGQNHSIAANQSEVTISCGGLRGRYVGIRLSQLEDPRLPQLGEAPTLLEFGELEVYPVSDEANIGGINVAALSSGGQCVNASENVTTCGDVIDGLLTPRPGQPGWLSAQGVGSWIQLKFDGYYFINRAKIAQSTWITGQSRTIRLTFCDGSYEDVELSQREGGDLYNVTQVYYDEFLFNTSKTDSVKMTVLDAYTASTSGFIEAQFITAFPEDFELIPALSRFQQHVDRRSTMPVLAEVHNSSLADCAIKCLEEPTFFCQSFQYTHGSRYCEMLGLTADNDWSNRLVVDSSFSYFERHNVLVTTVCSPIRESMLFEAIDDGLSWRVLGGEVCFDNVDGSIEVANCSGGRNILRKLPLHETTELGMSTPCDAREGNDVVIHNLTVSLVTDEGFDVTWDVTSALVIGYRVTYHVIGSEEIEQLFVHQPEVQFRRLLPGVEYNVSISALTAAFEGSVSSLQQYTGVKTFHNRDMNSNQLIDGLKMPTIGDIIH
ncbi:MFGE8 [Branchiostoma lanceolatum]|uniref:MFGE8 protein n=1 Tax=Branchiostoma lanceolatum TaxID=7740 RepID=A0A8J9ZLN3_BRALA|nr:MFGE8 [Branchiostoma lanceolatum]